MNGKTINQLHDDWISAGQKVTDLLNKKIGLNEKYKSSYNSMSDEEKANFRKEMEQAKQDYDAAVQARDFAKGTFEDAQEAMKTMPKPTNGVPVEKHNSKSNFADGFRDMLRHPMKYMENIATSDPNEPNTLGLAIPDDQQTKINTLERQYDSLKDLITVENVGTDHGSRDLEKLSEIKPMPRLDQFDDQSDGTKKKNYNKSQNTDIPEGDYPSIKKINYVIGDYGAIFYASNDLLNDSDANVEDYLNRHIALKNTVTYNHEIISRLPQSPNKATLKTLDDISDAVMDLDMALWDGSVLLINKSAFKALKEVRLADGHHALTTDARTNITTFKLDESTYAVVRVVEDRWLPDNKTAAGKFQSHPFYYGNFKEFLHLFDRQQPQLLTSNIAAHAFERNQTAIRSLLRMDLQVWDDEAIISGSFDKIASQPLIFSSVGVPSSTDAADDANKKSGQ